jgi:CubicO group peptidase (beta-lactamase class C family)
MTGTRLWNCCALLLAGLAPLGASAAATFDPAALAQLDAYFAQVANAPSNEQGAAGYVVLISEHDKITHQAALGFKDRAQQLPMTMQTRFRIASMTKPIVATVIMQLVEEHKIALDDPLQNYLPEYANMQIYESDYPEQGWVAHPARHMISIRQLLSHSAGLGYAIGADPKTHFGQALYQVGGPMDQSLAEFSQKFAQLPLYFEPGQGWRYSYSFDVLGRLIEVITHQTLEQALTERVFKPLQMTHTTFHVSAADQSTLATVYRHTPEGTLTESRLPLLAQAITPHAWESGGGGLVSTAEDYWHFASMLLNGGSYQGKRLLTRQSVVQMTSVQVDTKAYQRYWGQAGLGQSYGLGLGMVIDASAVAWPSENGEFAWGGALDTHWFAIPQRHVVAILLAQNDPTGNLKPQMTDVDFHRLVYAAIPSHH